MSEFGFAMDAPAPKRVPVWQVVGAALVIIAVLCFWLYRALSGPADYEAGTQKAAVAVTVHSGDSLSAIGATLAEAGVVASREAFVEASNANLRARYITPGDYKVPAHIPAATAVTLLLSPDSRDELRIVIPEGLRVAKVQAIIASTLHVSPDDVAAAIKGVALPTSSAGAPEGYLFPATYAVSRTATAADVVTPLQFDSTVNYGLGLSSEKLSQDQLNQDTPYNTYVHTGLPPTPIDNPGSAAIEAALSPARGDWLYFVTTDPKKKVTEFANTYDEFLALKAKYQRNS